jgi:hypothetical protein
VEYFDYLVSVSRSTLFHTDKHFGIQAATSDRYLQYLSKASGQKFLALNVILYKKKKGNTTAYKETDLTLLRNLKTDIKNVQVET